MAFGIATLDFREIKRAAIALALGSAIAILLSVVMVAISPVQTITSEIAGRTRPTLFDLLVALLSAIAGAYALIRGRGGIQVDMASRTLRATAAPLPGLGMEGYRALEGRAHRLLQEWNVNLSHPEEVELPPVPINSGVIDPVALDAAAWGAARLSWVIAVHGVLRPSVRP